MDFSKISPDMSPEEYQAAIEEAEIDDLAFKLNKMDVELQRSNAQFEARAAKFRAADEPKKSAPASPPNVTAADLKFELEEFGHVLAQTAERYGPQSQHYLRKQQEHVALQQRLAAKQVEEHEAMVRAAAEIDTRRKARSDAEAQMADEREQTEAFAKHVEAMEGRFAADEYRSRSKAKFTDEALEARTDEAFARRWHMLETTAGAAESTRDLPPSMQEQAREQARRQVETGSATYVPKLSDAQAKAVAQALSGEPHAAYVAEVLDREVPGWKKSDVYRRLRARNLGQ